MNDNTIDNKFQASNARIVVHPGVKARSEALGGVGCTVCNDMHTGETWEEYDLQKIKDAERDRQEMLDNDFGYQATRVLATVAIGWECLKKNPIGTLKAAYGHFLGR